MREFLELNCSETPRGFHAILTGERRFGCGWKLFVNSASSCYLGSKLICDSRAMRALPDCGAGSIRCFIQMHEAIFSRGCDLRKAEQFSPELIWQSGRNSSVAVEVIFSTARSVGMRVASWSCESGAEIPKRYAERRCFVFEARGCNWSTMRLKVAWSAALILFRQALNILLAASAPLSLAFIPEGVIVSL